MVCNVVREHFNKIKAVLAIFGDLLKSPLVVLGVAFHSPYLNVSVAYDKIGPLNRAPFRPRTGRLHLMGEAVLGKPFVNGLLPMRLHEVSVRAAAVSGESGATQAHASREQSVSNQFGTNLVLLRERSRRFALSVSANDSLHRQIGNERWVSHSSTATVVCLLGDLWFSQVCPIWRTGPLAHLSQMVRDGLSGYAESVGNLPKCAAAAIFLRDCLTRNRDLFSADRFPAAPLVVARTAAKVRSVFAWLHLKRVSAHCTDYINAWFGLQAASLSLCGGKRMPMYYFTSEMGI